MSSENRTTLPICDIYVRDLHKYGDLALELPLSLNLSVGDAIRWRHEQDDSEEGPMWVREILPRPNNFHRRHTVIFQLGKPKQPN